MNKYNILVNQYSTAEVTVEASTYEEAREKALEKAENLDWGSFDRFYQTADENGVFGDIDD